MTSRRTALAMLAALAVGVSTPALASTVQVRVGPYYFEDASSGDGRVVVNKGDQITFRFEGPAGHTATVAGMFASGVHSSNETYTTPALTRVGSYTLYCEVHGAAQHSTRLVIRDPAAPSRSPSPTAKPSPKPSPRLSPKASPTPSPRPSPRPTASPSPQPSPSPPAASPSTPPSPTVATPSSPPSPRATASEAPAGATRPTPSADPLTAPVDVQPAAPIDDSAPSWLLPGAVLAFLALAGAGAIALGRRRQAG